MTSAPAIGFDYRPSRWPRYATGAVALLALIATLPSGLAWWWKLALDAAILIAVMRTLRRLARSSIAGVGLAGALWTLYRTDRTEVPATLASFRVLAGFVLLRLVVEGRSEVLVLASDNSDADLRRRLRMRLAALRTAEAIGDPVA